MVANRCRVPRNVVFRSVLKPPYLDVTLANFTCLVGDRGDTACIVRQVVPSSAAFEAGVIVDDVIIAFEGQSIASFADLAALIPTRKPNDVVTLRVLREGEELDVELTLKRRGKSQPP